MNKIKILTSIVGLSSLTAGLVPTIASCSCNQNSVYSVELTSKSKERSFNNNSGGSAWVFKLSNEETAKATKVKLINLTVNGAETTPVAGLIKTSYDSGGELKVVVDTNMLLTQWPNGDKFKFSLEFTNTEDGSVITLGEFTLNLDFNLEVVDFELCNWSTIIERTDAFYKGELPLRYFIPSFGDHDLTPFTTMDDFIGLERSFKINNLDHVIRVIGTQCDTVADGETYAGTKALFTFEMKTLLSGVNSTNNGALCCRWDQYGGDCNRDYTSSILRNNLNGITTNPANWYTSSSGSGTLSNHKSALQMLQDEETGDPTLEAAIKSTNHRVSITTKTWASGVIVDHQYSDKLFIPNYYNLTSTESEYCKETKTLNPIYKYYANAEEAGTITEARIKAAYNGTDIPGYWISSPYTNGTNQVFYVHQKGSIVTLYTGYTTIGVCFAFCI